nr:reverse transcriptase domain-containing protein [Tanacetum cinerariifolium]
MRTRSSSNLPVVSSNLSTSNLKRRNRRRSKQSFILEESPIDTMADQCTMAELLRAPTEGYAEAIVAWDRYKDLLCACPHHGFTKSHQLNIFYNALNPTDKDYLNAAAGGNLLERHTQDVLTIIENKSKVRNSQNKSVVSQVKSCDANSNSSEIAKLTHAINQQTSAVTTAMTASLKQFQATPPPDSVKVVEEICVTCGGAHPYYQCLVAGGNTFLELRDNIQGYVLAAAVNYNQGNSVYRPPGPGSLPSNTIANPKGELKAITTQSGNVLDGPTIPTPPTFINPEEDERVEETLTDPDLDEYTIKVPPPPVQKYKPLKLKCKALADLGASINLMPLSVWKKLANFVIVDYESDHRIPLILGRPFLRTARALIDVHGEEMILCDSDERLTLTMRHDTLSYSNQPQKESINLINVFNKSSIDFLEDLFSNQSSGNPTFLSHPELTSPEVKNDIFDSEGGNVLREKLLDLDSTNYHHPPLHVNLLNIESDLKEIEFLLHQDIDSSLKDLIDQSNLANLADNFVDSMPEMFTDEHALDYSSPPIFDEYDDDFLEVESDAENDFSKVDALPSTNNEDKIFNSGILSQENPFEIITRVAQDKKLATSNASLVFKDFDPPFYEPLFFKKVPSIPGNLKTNAEGFCPSVFISLAAIRESCILI